MAKKSNVRSPVSGSGFRNKELMICYNNTELIHEEQVYINHFIRLSEFVQAGVYKFYLKVRFDVNDHFIDSLKTSLTNEISPETTIKSVSSTDSTGLSPRKFIEVNSLGIFPS